MIYVAEVSKQACWGILGFLIFEFVVLLFTNVGFFPLWTLIEYLQLIAVVPLNNFRIVPFVYDTFKPLFVTHFVFTDQNLFFPDI